MELLKELSPQTNTPKSFWKLVTLKKLNVLEMRKTLLILLMTAFIVASVSPISAQDSDPRIRMRVLHENRLPIAGAEVKVPRLNQSELTDDSGYVRRAIPIPWSLVGSSVTILATHKHYYTDISYRFLVEEGLSEYTIVMKTLFVDGYVEDTSAAHLPVEGVVIRITNYPQPAEADTSDSLGHFRIESERLVCTTPSWVDIVADKVGYGSCRKSLRLIKENQRIQVPCANNR